MKRSGSAHSQYTVGHGRQRRFKRRSRYARLLAAGIAVLAAVVLIYGAIQNARLRGDVLPYENTFLPGVTVEGHSLTGMTQEEAVDYLNAFYAESLNHQINITYEGQTWVFSPTDAGAKVDVDAQVDAAWQYGKSGDMREKQAALRELKENPVDLPVTLTYDQEALHAFVNEIKQAVDKEPVDASIAIIGGSEKPQITDSSNGLALDDELLKQQLTQVILSGSGEDIALTPKVLLPDRDTMDVSAEFVLLAECTTSLEGSSSARTSNVAKALACFDGLVLHNGEKISFNQLVGDRTERNGFKEATEYAGTTIAKGIGGGVCQASTTLYGAVLRVPIQVNERSNHKMSVSYVPASQDAAVSYPDKDLVFTNTIGETLYFFTEVDKKKQTATVKIYGAALNIDYYITIRTEVIERDIKSGSISYKDDTAGEKVWYTDQKVLYKVGKTGLKSRAYRQYVNILTGEVIHEELLSEDYYQPESDTYLRGVHER